MASIAVISKDKHLKTRIKSNFDLVHMKDKNVVTVSIKEISRATANFPVVFVKHPESGELKLVALLGFGAGENLFYDKTLWKCSYAPLMILSNPFVIGPDDSGDNTKLTACLDEDSEYVSETEGAPLYNEDGTESEFLKHHKQLLGEIFDGEVRTHKFIQRLQELELITGFSVGLQTLSGQKNRYTGLFTIDELKLRELDKDVVFELHQNGFLSVINLILASAGQFHNLMKLKNVAFPQDRIDGLQLIPENGEQAA